MRTDISAVSNPLLYYNDRTWPREDNLPIIEKYNLYFVPVTLFEQLRDVNVLINENFNTFMIEHGDKYLTFEVGTDFAVNQDKVRMFIMTYEHYDEYYVPVETVCDMLDLGYETLTSSITGETALRVTDGSQKYTFAECIFRKYPGFFLPETTTKERVTTDETTKPTTSETTTRRCDEETTVPAPVLGERTIYLTIEDSPGDATEDILDVLKRYGYKATFFIIGDAARENPVLLSRIVGEGHALGLHTMSHDVSSLVERGGHTFGHHSRKRAALLARQAEVAHLARARGLGGRRGARRQGRADAQSGRLCHLGLHSRTERIRRHRCRGG